MYYAVEYRNSMDRFFELQHYPPRTSTGKPVESGLVDTGAIFDMYVTPAQTIEDARGLIPENYTCIESGLCYSDGVDDLFEVYRQG